MIKRIAASILLVICFLSTYANKEISVDLNAKNNTFTENLGFAFLTFEYLGNHWNNALVKVSMENITQTNPMALMVFRRDMPEDLLKKNRPKIVFVKNFVGQNKYVSGCEAVSKYLNIIIAAQSDSLCTLEVPLTSSKDIVLPIYLAKYDQKKLNKKGPENVNYTILEEYKCDIHIKVEGWNEDNPTYQNMKKSVDEYIASLNGVGFCDNKKHSPSLEEQQRIYLEVKDSLISEITSILEQHREWMSDYAPHIAYSNLLKKLKDVDLNSYIRDCNEHNTPRPHPTDKTHNCSSCSLSEQDIFNQLNDIYVALYAHKIPKSEAVKKANALNTCYLKNKKRSQSKSLKDKINKFYNQIVNY